MERDGAAPEPPAVGRAMPAATVTGRPRSLWRSLTVVGAGMVGGSLALLSSGRMRRVDVRLGDLVRRGRRRPSDRLIAAATDLGSLYGVLGTASALALAGHRRLARDVAVIGSAAWLVAQGAKTGVKRERPYEAEGVARLIRAPTGSSYPSGHAAVAAAMMSVIAADGDSVVRTAAGALTAFVAVSRVYVGVHYPSDVLGGVGIGVLLARIWQALHQRSDAPIPVGVTGGSPRPRCTG